jgi:anti-anti-sigma factor
MVLKGGTEMSPTSGLDWGIDEDGETLVLQVRGDIDMLTSLEFTRVVRAILGRGRPTFVDLSRVRYLDSTGVRALEEMSGIGNIQVKVSPEVRRLLEVLHIEDRFTFLD